MDILEMGEQIRVRRKLLGIDQATLAELSDISVPTLSKIETGKGNPTLKVINRVLDVLGLALSLSPKAVDFG